MDLTPYVAALRDDLDAAGSVGDEATARAATSLAAALEPAVRLTLMNALSDVAGEISAALPDHEVDLRLHGREIDVAVRRADPDGAAGFFAGPSSSPFVGGPAGGSSFRPGGPPPPPPHEPGPPPHGGPDVGDISRMTLRIVDQIKGQAERAAAAQGMSLNSWVAQAVQGALRGPGGRPGHPWDMDWPGRDWPGRDWPGRAEDPPRTGPTGTDTPGTDTPGTDDPGNDDPGNDDPGNDDPGSTPPRREP